MSMMEKVHLKKVNSSLERTENKLKEIEIGLKEIIKTLEEKK